MLIIAIFLLLSNYSEAKTNYIIDQPWNSMTGWSTSGSGTKEISPAGELHLYATAAAITDVSKTGTSIPGTYSAEYRLKIDSFGDQNGLAIYDGAYRMHMYFKTDGVYVREADGVLYKKISWSSDTDYHVYRTDVENGLGRLYYDGAYVATWNLRASTGPDNFTYFVQGSPTAEMHVDYSRIYSFEYTINQPWDNMTGWDSSGSGSKEISPAGQLHLVATSAATTDVSKKDIAIPGTYSAEFRLKIDSFGTQNGLAIYDGAYRMHMFFQTDGVYVREADGTLYKKISWSSDTSFHVYRVDVDNGLGRLYYDGTYMATWNLRASTGPDKFQYFVNGSPTAEMHVDYSKMISMDNAPIITDEGFSSLSAWSVSGTGTKEISPSGQLHLTNSSGNDVSASRNVTIPYKYRVDFKYKVDAFGENQGIIVYDGKYRMFLYFKSDGLYIKGWGDENHKIVSWSSDTNWHHYRVDVDKGFGRVYFDGDDVGNYPLNKNTSSDEIRFFVGRNSVGEAHVDYIKVFNMDSEISSTYSYSDSFEDETAGTNPNYWMETTANDDYNYTLNLWTVYSDGGNLVYRANSASNDTYSLLHVFSRDVSFQSMFKVNASHSGTVLYFHIRRNEDDAYLYASYSFADQKWRLIEKNSLIDSQNVIAISSSASPLSSGWHTAKITAVDDEVQFFLDGEQTPLLKGTTSKAGLGRVGLEVKNGDVFFDEVRYAGEGRVNDGIKEIGGFESANSTNIVKLSNGKYIFYGIPTNPLPVNDDFEDGNANGWSVQSGTWSVTNDSGNEVYRQSGTGASASLSLSGSDDWTNYSVEAKVKYELTGGTDRSIQLIGRYNDSNNYYSAEYNSSTGVLSIKKKAGGTWTTLNSKVKSLSANTFYTFKLSLYSDFIKLYIDGVEELIITDLSFTSGKIGIGTYHQTASFDDIANIEYSGVWESSDSGDTWMYIPNTEGYSRMERNALVLSNGNLISFERVDDGNRLGKYRVWSSSDNGSTWSGPYYVNSAWKARGAVAGKVMQDSAGRVWFAATESSNLLEGSVAVYYSDDDGETWTTAKEFEFSETGISLQEGTVVQTGTNSYKAFFRTDLGFLYASESTNNGLTWSNPAPTIFPSTRVAFAVWRDPSTGYQYVAWENVDTNDVSSKPQFPRNRVSLAVSTDGTATWQFAADLDDFMVGSGLENRHINHSMSIIDGAIWLQLARVPGDTEIAELEYELRIWKIQLNKIQTYANFQGVHNLSLYR
ncbi:sialidase family protein [Paenibacillus koleovorans]|uniref:sialidase family protein n=1 Tax=Paenibacillus koleovorans TaxID=121608 RepID=UPI0013E289F9|nr:sialidase family protein [Paenibacillus koleovorans]